MNKNSKKILLERKFTSIEYMTLYVNYFNRMVDSLVSGMDEFKRVKTINPLVDEHNFSEWINRGYPILESDRQYAVKALEKAKNGDASEVSGSAGNLKGLSRDVDNIGGFGLWWEQLDEKYWDAFWDYYKQADTAGCNIYYTFAKHWDDDEILRESITGPIDEKELLNYLQPGETLESLAN